MTHPTDAEAVLTDTDLYIRQIAEAADAALSARPTFATPDSYGAVTNANGDIAIRFPALRRVDGVILHAMPGQFAGQTTRVRPPGLTIDLFMSYQRPILKIGTRGWLNPADPGVIWAHVFVRATFGGGQHPYSFGMQRAAAGQTVRFGGIAWGVPA